MGNSVNEPLARAELFARRFDRGYGPKSPKPPSYLRVTSTAPEGTVATPGSGFSFGIDLSRSVFPHAANRTPSPMSRATPSARSPLSSTGSPIPSP